MEIVASAMMHPFPVSNDLEEDWFKGLSDKGNRAVWFGILHIKDSLLIGFTFLNEINWINRSCMLGIVIGNKNYQGSGLGKEVMDTIINYAWNSLNLRKISLEVRSDHTTAVKLYEELGFIREGLLKDHYFNEGIYNDALLLSLFKDTVDSGK